MVANNACTIASSESNLNCITSIVIDSLSNNLSSVVADSLSNSLSSVVTNFSLDSLSLVVEDSSAVEDSSDNKFPRPTIKSLVGNAKYISSIPCGQGVLGKFENQILAFKLPTHEVRIIKEGIIYCFDKDGAYQGFRIRE